MINDSIESKKLKIHKNIKDIKTINQKTKSIINEKKENMNIVIVGHVDHGKSTIIGRLLADTNSLPQGKLEQVKESCRRNSKPFEYAFLLDALKEEQKQGITIDSARCFFKTKKRNYIIIDAPGHIEFLKNMITGASRAEAALLVIDAKEGVRENSKRHLYMLSMLGIKQIAVLINKMDLVNYNEQTFYDIVKECMSFLKNVNLNSELFIPVSGMEGDNIAVKSKKISWYKGPTTLSILDQFNSAKSSINKPFRMPVQGVYKFTNNNDDRRIIAGTIDSGLISAGDEIVFYPSGKKSIVNSLESFNSEPKNSAGYGEAVGFTLKEQIYVKRGEIASLHKEKKPNITTRIKVNIFWLSKNPMLKNKEYILKIGTSKVNVIIEDIINIMDASNLKYQKKDKIERHEIGECILKLSNSIAFDLAGEIIETSRFVIVDNYEISGGGIILESLEDKQSWVREKVLLRNYKWELSEITNEERSEKYNQKSTLIFITGTKDVGKKRLAKALENQLFKDGKIVYFLGIGNVLYGVDADIKGKNDNKLREEHIRRMAEVCNILLDAGVILIVTAIELTQDDLELVKASINLEKIETIWLGNKVTSNIAFDLHIPELHSEIEAVNNIKRLLQNKGIIFKPW